MITVFTIEHDITTHEVVDWIDYYGMDIYIITPKNIIQKAPVIFNAIRNGNICTFWFRKWSNDNNSINFKEATAKESFKIVEYIYHKTKETSYWLNNPYDYQSNNKPVQEHYAQLSGLQTPKSWLVNSREQLKSIAATNTSIITKSMGSLIIRVINGSNHFSYTTVLDRGEVNECPEYFFPSYIQEYIEKEYEIRSFYLDGEFFSMAIFSQANENTKIDFRHYDKVNPNRYEPIVLSAELESKLKNFIAYLGTNCGSFDLIMTPTGQTVFLEVNVLGQFGMVSKPCNYNLEEKVAIKLIEEHKKRAITDNKEIQNNTIHHQFEDALCMNKLSQAKTISVKSGFYSSLYESEYGYVKDLQKHTDTLC
ncbi:MAG: hypothetical protein PHU66_05770 [Bacteroidaceae bacterium]|nr:hypothetical protein [Bacteroidaceae bacterium]